MDEFLGLAMLCKVLFRYVDRTYAGYDVTRKQRVPELRSVCKGRSVTSNQVAEA